MPDDVDPNSDSGTSTQPSPAAQPPPDTGADKPDQSDVPKDSPLYQPPVKDTSSDYDDAVQQYLKATDRYQKDTEQNAKDRQWVHQQMQHLLSQPLPKMPSYSQVYPQQTAPPEAATPGGIAKNLWGSLAGYAAIALPLAFMIGRKGPAAWGAMNGMGKALEAISQGAEQRGQQAITLWKAQNDQAIKIGEQRMSYYKDILANRKTDLEEKMQLLQHTADYFEDRQVADKAEAGNWKDVVDVLRQRDQLVANAQKWRAQHEMGILKEFGLDAAHKDYIGRLAAKNPDLRDGLSSSDPATYRAAYDKAVKRYTWDQYIQDRKREIGAETKARKDAGEEMPGEGDDTEQDQSMSPEDQQSISEFAKKFRGGQ